MLTASTGLLTGTPIQTKPNFNIMIGPSPYVLINMGARFTPCMHNIRTVIENDVTSWPCPNTTSLNPESLSCSLSQLCGNGGVPDQQGVTSFTDRTHEPNQWWRFIVPIFLHAGIIHIAFNMLLQLTLGRDMEKEIGSLRFTLVYFSSGIFGFILGGNYAAEGLSSVGASGSLFGILALTLLDLLYTWSTRRSPVKDLLFLLLDIAIAFVLGLLPGLDNFSHIGGFLMGIVLGVCLLHSPQALRQRIGHDEPPYATVDTQPLAPTSAMPQALSNFAKAPVGFFKGRKPLWWAWWLVRVGGLVCVFIGFILLLRNFYEWRNTCKWCKHLTCLVSFSIYYPSQSVIGSANIWILADFDGWCRVVRYGRVECHEDDGAGGECKEGFWARGSGGVCGGEDDVTVETGAVHVTAFGIHNEAFAYQHFELHCRNTPICHFKAWCS
jgi:membrane associated rhomboid family serine protease